MADKPFTPYIGVLTLTNKQMPVRVGTMWFLTYGPEKHEVVPLHFTGLTDRKLEFRCACGQDGCTRKAKAVLKWEGHHPYRTGG